MPKQVTVQEAAEILGVTDGRVRLLLGKGRIKGATKFGKAWAIPLGSNGKPVVLPGKPVGRPWPKKKTTKRPKPSR